MSSSKLTLNIEQTPTGKTIISLQCSDKNDYIDEVVEMLQQQFGAVKTGEFAGLDEFVLNFNVGDLAVDLFQDPFTGIALFVPDDALRQKLFDAIKQKLGVK